MDGLLKEMIELYKTTDLNYREIGDRFGLNKNQARGRIRRWLKKHPEHIRSERPCKRSKDKNIPDAMSEDLFIRPYNWKSKLREGLASLEPGTTDAVIADDDFRRYLGIPKNKWKKLKQMSEFKEYQLLVKSSVYWCQPETGRRLRAKIELSDEVL